MTSRTEAVLRVLQRGRDEKLAGKMLKIFGVATLDECLATYATLGKAERPSLDEAIERMTNDAGAAFALSVDNEMRR